MLHEIGRAVGQVLKWSGIIFVAAGFIFGFLLNTGRRTARDQQ